MKSLKIWKTLHLPSNDRIALVSSYADSESLSAQDINHNIFRLNPQGAVVWQVKRDDSVRRPDWWEVLHAQARERGEDGAREPFMEFILKYPDGSDNINPNNGCPPDEAIWTPDCTIWLRGSAYQQYILNPETGIAKNVTEGRPRPW
jgi:hypothetical protein